MKTDLHAEALRQLFLHAPISKSYSGIDLHYQDAVARVTWPIDSAFLHGGNALHGSAIMRLLDDAAYFTAALYSPEFFIVTVRLDVRFHLPATSGLLHAIGEWKGNDRLGFNAGAALYDEQNRKVASAKGVFSMTQQRWEQFAQYQCALRR
ncbi:MAG: hypothetical protein ABR95_07360 [Sphingobacteriales bacterium BACL12 MAG-120813-bin55]|jgi:uncharacterized protein (TIGR00369 family)|nr:MAG: hypothetical protein ABR95_07360 [Sphingobacteriales bacterium BACL12 MAG-120813-bin55]